MIPHGKLPTFEELLHEQLAVKPPENVNNMMYSLMSLFEDNHFNLNARQNTSALQEMLQIYFNSSIFTASSCRARSSSKSRSPDARASATKASVASFLDSSSFAALSSFASVIAAISCRNASICDWWAVSRARISSW